MAYEELYAGQCLDYEQNCLIRLNKLHEEQERRKKGVKATNETWTTKEGKKMLMSEMTDEHINNAIRYFKRELEDLDCPYDEI